MARDTDPEQIVIPRATLEALVNHANSLVMAFDELDQIRQELSTICTRLGRFAGVRTEIHALMRKLNDLDPHKTPSRPPSSEAWTAFRRSSEFVAVRPPLPTKKRPGSK